mgnify:CR=1 FL=1
MFDPFKILGLKKSYSLKTSVIEKCYFEAQKKTHPDRFIGASADEKQRALQRSSEINQAYLILKNPLQRAEFLLKEAEIIPLSHDPLFLEEVMVWNERFEKGEDLALELQREKKTYSEALEKSFAEKDYEKARRAHYRLTYLDKFLKDVGKKK